MQKTGTSQGTPAALNQIFTVRQGLKRPRRPRPGRQSLAIVSLALNIMLAACGQTGVTSGSLDVIGILAVDRTTIGSYSEWPDEVAATTRTVVQGMIASGVGELDIIGIGRGTVDATLVATVNLRPRCSNARRCEETRLQISAGAARAAAEVAARPVQPTAANAGTDIIAAITTGAGLCDSHACRMVLITDGIDSRLREHVSVEDLVDRYAPTLPSLKHVAIELVGLGADDSTNWMAARAKDFWQRLLSSAGATDIRIGRSL